MTFNEWLEYLGNLEMWFIVVLLAFALIMIALMPFISAFSEYLAEKIVGGVSKAVENIWCFVTRRAR